MLYRFQLFSIQYYVIKTHEQCQTKPGMYVCNSLLCKSLPVVFPPIITHSFRLRPNEGSSCKATARFVNGPWQLMSVHLEDHGNGRPETIIQNSLNEL